MKFQLTQAEFDECVKELEYYKNPNHSLAGGLIILHEMLCLKQYEKRLENNWFYRRVDLRHGLRKRQQKDIKELMI